MSEQREGLAERTYAHDCVVEQIAAPGRFYRPEWDKLPDASKEPWRHYADSITQFLHETEG